MQVQLKVVGVLGFREGVVRKGSTAPLPAAFIMYICMLPHVHVRGHVCVHVCVCICTLYVHASRTAALASLPSSWTCG